MKTSCLSSRWVPSLVLLGLLLCGQWAQATIVYDNAAGGAAGIDGGTLSDDRSATHLADDVTLMESVDITGIEWSGMFLFGDNVPPPLDQFSIGIYSDAAGEPTGGAPLALFPIGDANRTDSGVDYTTADIYEFSADINFTMQAGVTYWVSIYNDSAPDDDRYYWAMLNDQGNSAFSGDAGATWSAFGDRLDFRLLSVPEPATPSILAGCGVLLLKRKRQPLSKKLDRGRRLG